MSAQRNSMIREAQTGRSMKLVGGARVEGIFTHAGSRQFVSGDCRVSLSPSSGAFIRCRRILIPDPSTSRIGHV